MYKAGIEANQVNIIRNNPASIPQIVCESYKSAMIWEKKVFFIRNEKNCFLIIIAVTECMLRILCFLIKFYDRE